MTTEPEPDDLITAIRSQMYEPCYPLYVDEVNEHEDGKQSLARVIAEAATTMAQR
jgi:hypothetical protein